MTDTPKLPDGLVRCFGNSGGQEDLANYHDTEWGVPVHDDRHLFEMLTLEGAQAGLSREVVLRKRAGYRRAFHDFDIARVAEMSDEDPAPLRVDAAIVRDSQHQIECPGHTRTSARRGQLCSLSLGICRRPPDRQQFRNTGRDASLDTSQ